ncbi:class I SAM-dependent methyltransferase [Candidatus Omnitrophota bacterium]
MQKKIRDIIGYWDGRVSRYGATGKSTLLDDNMRALEVETVRSWLGPKDRALEVCCGNGVSTLEFAKSCASITGIDLSKGMIKAAKRLAKGSRRRRCAKVDFEAGNVLGLADTHRPGKFNTVISVRGLINLPSWELQKEAILNIHKILPRGGKFIFLEGSKEGLLRINKLRKKFSLAPLREPWYDKHFKTGLLNRFMASRFRVRSTRDLDVYFLMSRILYPSAVRPDEPRFDSLCNTLARLMVPFVRTDTRTTLLVCNCYIKR